MPAVATTENYVRPTQESLLIYEAQRVIFGQLLNVYYGLWRVYFWKLSEFARRLRKPDMNEVHLRVLCLNDRIPKLA